MRILSFLPALIICSLVIYFIVKYRGRDTFISKPSNGAQKKLSISVFQILVVSLLLIITGIISYVVIAIYLQK